MDNPTWHAVWGTRGRCIALEIPIDKLRTWTYAEPAMVAVNGADANPEFQNLVARSQQCHAQPWI
eukprot:1591118-Lingulodinium_polyedra.AAC.1